MKRHTKLKKLQGYRTPYWVQLQSQQIQTLVIKSNQAHVQESIKILGIFTLKDHNCLRGLKAIGETEPQPTEETSETETTPLCSPP